MYIIACFIFFYIQQKRELKRFYKELQAITKEKQVSNVLDSQSDAIVVIQPNDGVPEDENSSSLFQFLFRNSMSIKLFGFNVMECFATSDE